MNFKDILNYLDELVGTELQPINDSTDSLVITDVNYEKSRYSVRACEKAKAVNRTFKELHTIWNVLSTKGFVNVDQALSGAGSSRNQPETILANLPFIEHFKYEKKKHLYLRDVVTHDLGTIKELSRSESLELKRRIDRYRDFDISQFYSLHSRQINLLKNKLSTLFTKYPGEGDVEAVTGILSELKELEVKLSESIVTLEAVNYEEEANNAIADNESGETDEDESGESDEGETGESDEGESVRDSFKPLEMSRINQVTPTVSLLFDRVKYGEINLQPEFQRGDRVWPVAEKSRLIESLLLGLPIPVFYFADQKNNDPDLDADYIWVIIDGLQRITALIGFMKEDYKLKGLKRLTNYNNLTFSQLPRREQRKIREYQLFGHLIPMSEDSDLMIRELFHRINTYGRVLSAQEIRAALYPGPANRFLKYIAESDEFIDAVPANISPNRMLDIEYVLRAVAFLLLGYESYNYSTVDDFLSNAMKELNKYKYPIDEPIEKAASIFIEIKNRLFSSFETISSIFGDDAYKKETGGKVNKVLFETLVSLFAMMTNEQRERMSSENIAKEFKATLFSIIDTDDNTSQWESNNDNWDNRGFDYSITNSTSKKITVLYRFRSIVNIINNTSDINFHPKPVLKEE